MITKAHNNNDDTTPVYVTIVTQIRRNQKIQLYNIMIVWMFIPGSGRAAWWPGRV